MEHVLASATFKEKADRLGPRSGSIPKTPGPGTWRISLNCDLGIS